MDESAQTEDTGARGSAWWRSITVKMMAGTLLLVVPTLLVGMWIAARQHKAMEMEQVEGDVEHVADAVRRSLDYASPPEMPAHRQHIERALGDLEFVENVQLVAVDGTIVFSRIPSEEGHLLDTTGSDPCSRCHERPGEAPTSSSLVFETPDGVPLYHGVFPIRNAPMCQRCHVADLEELGLLVVSFDVSSAWAEMRQFQKVSALTILIAMGVLMGGIAVLFRRLVGRPLARIGRDIGQVEAGRFELEPTLESRDELASLHGAVVKMAQQLAENRREMQEKVRKGSQDVEALTKRLETINSDLARLERLSTLGTVSARVVHEIRTPLNALSMNLQLLRRMLDGHEGEVAPATIELAENAHQEIERIGIVLGRFMERARVPRPSYSVEAVDELVKGVLMLLAADAREVGVTLSCRLTEPIEPRRLAADSVRQILINVVSNSIAACPPGSEVMVEVAPTSAERLQLTVVDSGEGIEEADLKRVFEPFYTTRKRGTGLGLAVVRQILDQMGGSIRIESTQGDGTRVIVEVPATPPLESDDG